MHFLLTQRTRKRTLKNDITVSYLGKFFGTANTMRIIVVTETFLPHIDGIVTRLTQTITHLRRMGHDALIIAPYAEGTPSEFQGAKIVTIPSVSYPKYPDIRLGLPLLLPSAEREITSFQPDIIHVASPAFVGLGPALSALRRRVPLVASYHVQYPEYIQQYGLGAFTGFVRWYLRTIHNWAKINLATSTQMAQDLTAHGVKRVQVWRPGVDAETYHPSMASAELRNKLTEGHPEDFLLVCVSRLAVEKSIDRLAPVLRQLTGVRLAIIGDGPARANLEKVFEGLPVIFTGMIKDKNVLAGAYASADVFAFLSSTETLGLVALEAMAAGTPVVVAKRGGLPDLVIDNQTGYLVEPEDVTQIVAAVQTLQQNPALLAAFRSNARAHAEEYSWSQTTTQLFQYYIQATQNQKVNHRNKAVSVPAD